ncbi:CCA tRNA nucleotidyltransferase [Algihabitans albus]|uniref:CCA tRNA nucleotidyltransferase n=1 Tax=Algihabitans albus TaxID=2164067 RepID=UPI000E5D3509|nr:CCA tRNA nucleotidyltransferase [Algihabitans albus]
MEPPRETIPPQDWMTTAPTRAVLAALAAGGAEARFVGGCVRDALAGRPVRDIDIATPAGPERVTHLIEAAGLKAVPTGLAHGTITAVAAHHPFEITTLREDVETFGRHATVAFTDDWRADAARRDFTMNALSCTPEGAIFDYFGGLRDLRAGRVRFVGKATQRIAEDYLRLLRFFRFHAHYGRGAPDPEGLAAAAAAAPELIRLSQERVRAELLRLLEAPDPVPTLEIMILHRILAEELPEEGDTAPLARLLALEAAPPDALLRLAALVDTDRKGADAIAARLRLSNAERTRLELLTQPPLPVAAGMPRKDLRVACYRLGKAAVADLLRLAAARGDETDGLEAALAEAAAWPDLTFPVKGRDLIALGVEKGPAIGDLLSALEAWWIDRDFRPNRAALLARAESLL